MNDTKFSSIYKYKTGEDILDKLNNFLTFEENWSYGVEGKAFNEITVVLAKKLYKYAVNRAIYTIDFFPGLDAEIMIALYYKKRYMEFIVKEDQILECLYEKDGNDVFHRENISLNDAYDNIMKMHKEEIWNTSELSTLNIGTHEEETSKAWPLETIMVAFHYSIERAQNPYQNQFVGISTSSIFQPQGHLSYSG